MPPPATPWRALVRLVLAQGIAFLLVLAAARILRPELPPQLWALAWGGLAALLSPALGLPAWWMPFQAAAPFCLDMALRHRIPAWAFLAAFLALLLVFGGGLRTRVPLFLSDREAWERLRDLLPARPGVRFLDLGAGLGGPLAHLAARRPDGNFTGIEASPLTWLLAWLRCALRPNATVRLGSLWKADLSGQDLVFAFLSPAPMARLWRKVRAEMAPGSRFVSHTFPVPGVRPDREFRLKARWDAVLYVYEIPSIPEGVAMPPGDDGHNEPDWTPAPPGPIGSTGASPCS